MTDTIYRDAVHLFGKDAQMIVCIEELAELQQALCKEMRPGRREGALHENDVYGIIEEIVDVEIMIEQMKYIFTDEMRDYDRMYSDIKRHKLVRLRHMAITDEVRSYDQNHTRRD